jgi:glycosyltransferase involved in cell wall biosynthesis
MDNSSQKIKIELIIKTPYSESGARGVDLYARKLYESLIHIDRIDVKALTAPTGEADIVHYTYFDPYFPTLKINPSSSTIVTVHDLIPRLFPSHFPAGIKGSFNWVRQQHSLKHAAAILTDSESSRKDIIRLTGIPEQSVHSILLAPGWDNDAQSDGAIREKYGLPESYILYVGDINWNKNIPGLIRAFSAAETGNVGLVLAGKAFKSNPNITEMCTIAEEVLNSTKASSIVMPGFIADEDMPALYRQATLYIQPSWYEGFGLPVLEALRFGCPVLSSSRGSLPEVGGPYAHYMDPTDGSGVVKVITELMRNAKNRRKYVIHGKKWALTFTWERTAKETVKVYEEIVLGRH